jgi:hypothetical protein
VATLIVLASVILIVIGMYASRGQSAASQGQN